MRRGTGQQEVVMRVRGRRYSEVVVVLFLASLSSNQTCHLHNLFLEI